MPDEPRNSSICGMYDYDHPEHQLDTKLDKPELSQEYCPICGAIRRKRSEEDEEAE